MTAVVVIVRAGWGLRWLVREARFTFLGTGTSAGIPSIGCACPVCRSADPRDTRLRTSALLRFIDKSGVPRAILLDCGPDLRQQALRAGMSRLDAILFTHNHVDHTFGLDEVRRFNALQRAPIAAYAEAHTLDFLRRVYQHIFDAQKNINQSFVATVIGYAIEPGHSFDLFGLKVTPIRVLHGKLPIVGYRFDAVTNGDRRGGVAGEQDGAGAADATAEEWEEFLPLVYCTDLSAVPPESWRLMRGARTLVLDALRHRSHPTHLTLGQAVSIAHELEPARSYFVHMAHEISHAAADAELPAGMFLAYDGLTLGAGKTEGSRGDGTPRTAESGGNRAIVDTD